MDRTHISRLGKGIIALSLLVSTFAASGATGAQAKGISLPPDNRGGQVGAVYISTNQAAGNGIAVYNRAADGSLTPGGTVSTGGLGTGSGLGSQGAIVLSENDKWLFTVNAGSNEISAFSVERNGLTLVDKVASGGTTPISLTSNNDLLYVLNSGGSGNITGFRVGNDGHLSPIANSTRPLSGNAVGPAQVQFSPNGDLLVVTEKATNKIDTYAVGRNGVANGPTVHASAGTTPFGFAFGKRNDLIVSEAFGGAANGSAVSSYNVERNGNVQVVSASSPTHQTAACWVVVTENGRYAYATNAGSGSISGYRIANDGSLSLVTPDGRTGVTGAGSTPIDMGLSNNSHYLYALTAGSHGISIFTVNEDGSLTANGSVSGLPIGAAGVASR